MLGLVLLVGFDRGSKPFLTGIGSKLPCGAVYWEWVRFIRGSGKS